MKKKSRTARPSSRAARRVVHDFKEKVRFTIEWQGYPVSVVRLPYPPLEEMQSDQDEFKPHRLLLNPAIVRTGKREHLVSQFNPPLGVRIAYTRADLKRAQQHGLEHPQIGFWDSCKWVLFTAEKHQLRWDPPGRAAAYGVAGYAVVHVSRWSDPAIGLGP